MFCGRTEAGPSDVPALHRTETKQHFKHIGLEVISAKLSASNVHSNVSYFSTMPSKESSSKLSGQARELVQAPANANDCNDVEIPYIAVE